MKISDYKEQPIWNDSKKLYDNNLEKHVIEDILFKDIEDDLSEAERMKKECLKLGIKEEDIIMDKDSNSSLESLKNMRNNIDLKDEKSIIDKKNNYQNTTLGIQLANFDANHILRQAKEGIIAESDEGNYQKKK